MIEMQAAQASAILRAKLTGNDVRFKGMHNDTRKLRGGELYIAVRGENLDGHDYVQRAYELGATVALVQKPLPCPIAQILCDDTVLAMGQLAANWRQHCKVLLVALTGSNGKTTVKELMASIFRQSSKVHVTQGNLNNHIGVPLTLAGLSPEHDVAVIEMGANHEGEIDYLSRLAQPDICLINNAGAAHLEGFGSVEGVARTKGEIFSGLSKDGTGVLNADDAFFGYWQGLLQGKKQLSFGMRHAATVRGGYQAQAASSLQMDIDGHAFAVDLPLPGDHNAMNALAAAACAYAANCSLTDIQKGLQQARAVPGRMQILRGLNHARVVNDCYNANPSSLSAAAQWLAQQKGKRILVLGDMLELGAQAASLHRQAGVQAKTLGIDLLFALGAHSAAAVDGFGAGAELFADYDSLIGALRPVLDASTVVLIKGSRGMHMETVTQAVTIAE